ncbi:Sugar transporter, partial [Musa troglodytarum]
MVMVFGTFVSIATVDKLGRRALFLQGGAQMLASQHHSALHLLLRCSLCMVMGASGVAGAERDLPLEIRSAGQSITVSVNMFFTFLIAQVFLTALCHLKFGLFYFFAGWVAIMTAFIAFFCPRPRAYPSKRSFWSGRSIGSGASSSPTRTFTSGTPKPYRTRPKVEIRLEMDGSVKPDAIYM